MPNTKEIIDAIYNIVKNQEYETQNCRLLSVEEIISANEDMQVDFDSYGLIPVFDIFDNDFICYQKENDKWCFFNIVDEIAFKKDKTLKELLSFKK